MSPRPFTLPPDLATRLRRVPGARLAARSHHVRRAAAHVGLEPPNPRPVAPAQPVGAKLELTYACNLRCGFCYTDSPRRTLERATELTDDDWRRVVEEVIDLGAIEAVVTGGEPLLRRELTLKVIERLDAAGVGVTFNTNGWFVDEDVADRLAQTRSGINVHVSLDGSTPALHDAARGVPGSWRRAIAALGLLAERGVRTHIVQVVTPANEHAVEELVELASLIGAHTVRFTPVIPLGAAARERRWPIDEKRLRQRVTRACARTGTDLEAIVLSAEQTVGPVLAPAYLVVRPNGAVMAGTMSPFRFGDVRTDRLSAAWGHIVRDWDHPHVQAWREPILRGQPLPDLGTIPYRDEEVDVAEPAPEMRRGSGRVRLPRPGTSRQQPSDSFQDARRHVTDLALGWRYRLGAVRFSESDGGGRYVRVASGHVSKLNATAALVMAACTDGTPGDAVEEIAASHPGMTRVDLARDVLAVVRRLTARGILEPALALVPAPRPAGPVLDRPLHAALDSAL